MKEIDQATALCLRLDAVMGEAEEWGTGVDMLRSLEEHGLRVTVAPAEPCPRCKWADGCRRAAPSGHVVALEAALQSAEATLAAALRECDDFEVADGAHQGPSPRVTIQRIRDLLLARNGGGNGSR